MADRKLIELVIDEDTENFGVEAISLVKHPAIESDFIFFSAQKKLYSLAAVDEEQRTLIGPALIPDKHIPRYDEKSDEEYDVYFSQDTVKQASELFLREERTNKHTFEHQTDIDGVTVVESWLVEDPEMDKSKAYGLSVPKGTWMVRVKVHNEDVWESVKSGEVRGFSIEGYFVDKIVQMERQTERRHSFLRKVKEWFTKRKFYAEANLTSGGVLVTEDEAFTAGSKVYTLDEEGMPIELANGQYQTDGGIDLTVFEGVLTEYDGEVAAVEEAADAEAGEQMRSEMLVQYYKKYLTLQYEKKMSKKVEMAKASRDIEKIGVYMEPYDYDYRGHGFWIHPFKFPSYDAYISQLEEMQKAVGEEIEEWELVDTDYIGFRDGVTTDQVGIREEDWESIKEICEWLDDNDISWDQWQAYVSHMGGGMDQSYAEDAYMGHHKSVEDYGYELIDDIGIDKELAEKYFNWDAFGQELKSDGGLYSMIVDDWEDRYETEAEAMAAYEELYDMRDTELAEWYVYDVVGSLEDALGDRVDRYFDYKAFGRDLEYEYTEIEGIVWWHH